jgi:hypothetical protein
MNSNQRMIYWSSAWALVGGVVVCTGCMRGQSLSNSGESFTHEDNCTAKDEVTVMPWAELHQILDMNTADRLPTSHPLREAKSPASCIANCAFISATKLAIPRHESN